MKTRLLHQLPPAENNPRNSEGAFIRGKNGEILFAYSRYTGTSCHDHAACDIALITSADEGESWSEPRIIVKASFFNTQNVMSVSAIEQENGDIGFYFLIKENDFTTTIGRALSSDGVNFKAERCVADFTPAYYVINNDRFVRLKNGRILVPAAFIYGEENRKATAGEGRYGYRATMLYSDDDGKTFRGSEWVRELRETMGKEYGLQEPGVIEREDGSLYYWMRTGVGRQYDCLSSGDNINDLGEPTPGRFTSPPSPMQVKAYDGVTYYVYNPVPIYDGRIMAEGSWGRTPLVVRKSLDNKAFGELNIIENEEARGYCYPSIFKTEDGCLLLAYCRGDAADGNTLCRLGISKIRIDEIK